MRGMAARSSSRMPGVESLIRRGPRFGRPRFSPFFEPRAVASVPRTDERFRSPPPFRNDEIAVSGTAHGTPAQDRRGERLRVLRPERRRGPE